VEIKSSTHSDNRQTAIFKNLRKGTLEQDDKNEELSRLNFSKMASGLTPGKLEHLLYDLNRNKIYKEKEIGNLVWRAHGLLGLNPELATLFQKLFEDESVSSHTKKIMFTILTSHSTPEIQKVVRDLLNSDSVKNDKAYVHMIQEVSMIKKPEKETIEAIAEKVKETPHGDEKFASAYTLGAMINNLYGRGKDNDAKKFNEIIVNELLSSENNMEKQRLLVALSNAGVKENIDVVKKFIKEKDPETRLSAAMALRKTDTKESEELLLKLMSDQDKNVQNTAILMLSKYSNSEDQLISIKRKIEKGEITSESYHITLTLLSKNRKRYPQMINSICKSMLKDKGIARQIRSLMQ